MRICKNCHTEFATYFCRACSQLSSRKYKAKNPARLMVQQARRRAKTYGVPFDLTYDDITIPDRCPVLGIKLKRGTGHANDGSPTIDRIIPSLGYVRGNVAVISSKANRIKSNGTAREILAVFEWLSEMTWPPEFAKWLAGHKAIMAAIAECRAAVRRRIAKSAL
jgi:hypothetical protein